MKHTVHIQETVTCCLYESDFPVHTHHRITLCMACLYRVVLPPASGTCNGVLSALHSHLRRASTAFCTCECNMVTHYQRLRKSAPSVARAGDRATWYLTDTRMHSRAVSYHEAICHTHAGIYTYMELYMFPPHPSPVLPVTCTAPY